MTDHPMATVDREGEFPAERRGKIIANIDALRLFDFLHTAPHIGIDRF